MLLAMKDPTSLFAECLGRLQGTRLVRLTHGKFEELVALAKAAGDSGFCFVIGGRGTKLYPAEEPYIHFAGRCKVAASVVEVRGSDLHIGVDAPVDVVIEKLAAFAG